VNVGEDVRALVRRGGVTLAEYRELRCNSWEWEVLVPALDAEAFDHYARHVVDNCFVSTSRPCTSYPQALAHVVVPEALRRLREQTERARECELVGSCPTCGADQNPDSHDFG
jgi:hypothetical protein